LAVVRPFETVLQSAANTSTFLLVGSSCSYLAQSCFGAITPDDPAQLRMTEA
jgi:hypothetical protein